MSWLAGDSKNWTVTLTVRSSSVALLPSVFFSPTVRAVAVIGVLFISIVSSWAVISFVALGRTRTDAIFLPAAPR